MRPAVIEGSGSTGRQAGLDLEIHQFYVSRNRSASIRARPDILLSTCTLSAMNRSAGFSSLPNPPLVFLVAPPTITPASVRCGAGIAIVHVRFHFCEHALRRDACGLA